MNANNSVINLLHNKDHKPPPGVGLKKWLSTEANGFVFVWFHADDEPPSWQVKPLEQLEQKQWVYMGRTEDQVHCHLQEIPENGADFGHMDAVHRYVTVLNQLIHALVQLQQLVEDAYTLAVGPVAAAGAGVRASRVASRMVVEQRSHSESAADAIVLHVWP